MNWEESRVLVEIYVRLLMIAWNVRYFGRTTSEAAWNSWVRNAETAHDMRLYLHFTNR